MACNGYWFQPSFEHNILMFIKAPALINATASFPKAVFPSDIYRGKTLYPGCFSGGCNVAKRVLLSRKYLASEE